MQALYLQGPELDAEQYNYAKKHGLTPNIQCTGPLSHAQLEALYSISSALIFPSRYEGFGWPPLEAQCCGCPVIASSNGSLDEVIGIAHLPQNGMIPRAMWKPLKMYF